MKAGLILTVATAALIFALGFVWRERSMASEAVRARETVAQLPAALRPAKDRLERRLAQLQTERDRQARPASHVRNTDAATASVSSADPAKPTEEGGSTSTARKADVWEQSIRSDPTLQALRLAADRARLATDYAAFFRERRLTPEQRIRFQDITLRRDEAMADIDAAIQSQGLTEDDPDVERLRAQANDSYETEQKALLGVDGFRRMHEFATEISSRNTVRGLAVAALDAGIPLSPAQIEQLARSLTSQRVPLSDGWKVPDWAAIDESTQALLTPQQRALLQRIEPNLQGAAGRFWLRLTTSVDAARRSDLATKSSAAVQN